MKRTESFLFLFIVIQCLKSQVPHQDLKLTFFAPDELKRAIEIAEFENSVIQYEDNPDRYQKLTDENFILVSMAHSAYMRYSEKFSDILNNNWMRSV